MKKILILMLFVISFALSNVTDSNIANLILCVGENNFNVENVENQKYAFNKICKLNYGETICFCENLNEQEIFNNLQAKIISKNCISSSVIYLIYTQKLQDFVIVKGKRVNLQVSKNNNKVIVGYPLIQGCF